MVAREPSPSCNHPKVDVLGSISRAVYNSWFRSPRKTADTNILPNVKSRKPSSTYLPYKAPPKYNVKEPIVAGPAFRKHSPSPNDQSKREDVETNAKMMRDLVNGTSSMSIRQTDELCGADMPSSSRMSVREGCEPKAYSVCVYEPSSSYAAVTIPIFRENEKKAVALLVRGPEDPLRVAVSGWSPTPSTKYQLDRAQWTKEVFLMCKKIGHELTRRGVDQGIDGQFFACFPLKQLLAFLYFECPRVRNAKIHAIYSPSDDCVKCLELFERATGISIEVFVNGHQEWPLAGYS